MLITAGTILPGPGHERIDGGGAVLVDGDTIVAVGRIRDLTERDDGVIRHDFGSASTIVPGLINAHTHTTFDTSEEWLAHLNNSSDAELLEGMASRAEAGLRAGVTTIRDLGDRGGLTMQLRDSIKRGERLGPRILPAGPPLTPPQGHCWFLGGEVDGPDAIRDRIRRNAELGADVIKVMASGGQVTPDSPPTWQNQFSRHELEIIVEESNEAGLGVAAHAHGTAAIEDAVVAGVRTIEHCSWEGSDGQPDLREDIAEMIITSGTYVCHAWPSPWKLFADRIGPGATAVAMRRTRWMHQLGIPLIAGTDSGLPGCQIDVEGGLGFYTECGIPAPEVLEMATSRAAAALGRGDLGRLAPGCAADLLVVDGDPHSDLGALRQRRLVMSNGQDVTAL